MANYTVTYRTNTTHTAPQADAIQSLNEHESETDSVESVIENCRQYECDADLFDAAGFRKGWVHADGNYRLQ